MVLPAILSSLAIFIFALRTSIRTARLVPKVVRDRQQSRVVESLKRPLEIRNGDMYRRAKCESRLLRVIIQNGLHRALILDHTPRSNYKIAIVDGREQIIKLSNTLISKMFWYIDCSAPRGPYSIPPIGCRVGIALDEYWGSSASLQNNLQELLVLLLVFLMTSVLQIAILNCYGSPNIMSSSSWGSYSDRKLKFVITTVIVLADNNGLGSHLRK